MASVYIYKCDKCGKEARNDTQKELYEKYQPITMNLENRYSKLVVNKSYFYLCPDCLVKIGIVPDDVKFTAEENKSLSDRLFDIIAEIIQQSNVEGGY